MLGFILTIMKTIQSSGQIFSSETDTLLAICNKHFFFNLDCDWS